MPKKPTKKTTTGTPAKKVKSSGAEGEAEYVSAKKKNELLRDARFRFARELGADHIFNDSYAEFYLSKVLEEEPEEIPDALRYDYELSAIPELVMHKGMKPFYCPANIWKNQKVAIYVNQDENGVILEGGCQLWLFRVIAVFEPRPNAQRIGVDTRYICLRRVRIYQLPEELRGTHFRTKSVEWWKGTGDDWANNPNTGDAAGPRER